IVSILLPPLCTTSLVTATSLLLMYYFLFDIILPNFTFFFFNDTATTEIYTLSLHDALPILPLETGGGIFKAIPLLGPGPFQRNRSEEHTSELQSLAYLVCRLLLEKKKKKLIKNTIRKPF